METGVILLFIVAAIAGSALVYYGLKHGKRTREAIQNMAESEGWTYEHRPAATGRGMETIVRDPAAGWSVTMHFSSTRSSPSSSSGSTSRWTSFDIDDMAISGMSVLGPDIPEKAKKMADSMLGFMGGDLGIMLLNKLTGGLGEETQGLRTVDGPGPGTLMTTPGAETALDALRYAPELNEARAGRNEAQQPVVMRGSFGLRIRMGKYLKKPDEIREFAALGVALADNLRTSE